MTLTPSQLTVTTSVSPPALIEYAALCVGGWVGKNFIRGNANDYLIDVGTDQQHIFTVKKNSQARVAESQSETLKLILGAHQLRSTVRANSGWTKNFPPTLVFEWLENKECSPLSADTPVHSGTLLTLSTLGEIYEKLSDQRLSVRDLLDDATFNGLFPQVDFVAGQYEGMRHRSGNELEILWTKREFFKLHKIDAPNPVADLYNSWLAESGGNSISPKPENHGIYNKDGYLGTNLSRWHISKLLGEVPAPYQAVVFAWAFDAIWTIEEYHNTRGGVPLPDIFSCQYDDMIMTADRDLVFKKSKQE